MRPSNWVRRVVQYLVACGAAALAIEASHVLIPYLSIPTPFIFSFAATIASAWFLGLRPALVGIAVSALLFDYWFAEPIGSLKIGLPDLFALGLFVLEATAIAYFIAHIKGTRAEAIEANSELERDLQHRQSDLLKSQDDLRRLMTELTFTETRERRELASELHDYLAQLLVIARMGVRQALQCVNSSTEECARALQGTDDLLHRSIDYARSLMAELDPPQLYTSGLPAALQWLSGQMSMHGLTVSYKDFNDVVAVSDDHARLLYRGTRELLMNVVKHASAKQAAVTLTVDLANEVCVSVRDDGKGFDPTLSRDGSVPGTRFGLANIRERLTAHGGRMEIATQLGQGTTVTLLLPIETGGSASLQPTSVATTEL